MKSIYKVIFFSCFAPLYGFAQSYGQAYFPHSLGGAKMCDAITIEQHTLNPGSIMVGFQAISPPVNLHNTPYNFVVDRTGPGGIITGQNGSFQKAYQVHANSSDKCEPKTRPILNSAGVSIIETIASTGTSPQQAHYAFAGAYNEGCFFGLLDASGNCIYATSFLFPGKIYNHITQPKIIETANTPGEYIICGSMDNTMYAIRINSQGIVLWTRLYPIFGEPNDMMRCAYGNNKDNECIIVGKTDLDYVNNASDGFMMKLDLNNGAVILFKRLHMPTNMNNPGNQYFNSISILHKEVTNFNPLTYSPYGYIIGGYTDAFSGILHGNLLLYQIDSAFNHISLHIMTSPYDTTGGGGILDISSRRVNNNNKHVYYSLLKLDSGLSVLRSDRFISYGAPSYKEFHYPSFSNELVGNKIGLNNNPNDPNYGLHIYGTRNNNIAFGNNLLTTYFNGVSTCHSYTNITFFSQSPTSHLYDTIVSFGGLRHCQNFLITATEASAYVNMCGTSDSVAGGSNSRTIYQAEELQAGVLVNTKVFPNPSKNHVTLEYALTEAGFIQIELLNMLGQKLFVIEGRQEEAGTFQTELNLTSLGIEKGVYLINFEMAGERKMMKLIFEGD